ncbi:DUF4998 domain-containing protein [Chitinophaga sp. 22321]|uniref:Discoidin domain-containing protein n=1 Tax=Chitinophaga hostae TaxID=2831022 RepID=A0ABS5J3T3_9BACT|nr:DUF4998 domain-containing protein [Chitinophaga hostae]MBS0029881.1 discoidin domain-containing protein [Chitinophaga hostae]
MRNIFYLFVLIVFLWACKKMDSTYKQFVVPDGIVYTGKANMPVVHAGRNRAKISWLRGSDPNLAAARIYWNNFTDSADVPIPPKGDTITYMINNLPEKSYSFVIKTFDGKGHTSVPVELFGASYGDVYQSSLLSRPVDESILYTDSVSLKWGGADISNGAYATEVKYTSLSGNERVLRFPASAATSGITDMKPGTTCQYRTLFLPDSLSIDTFYTSYATSKPFLFSPTNWQIIAFSSQHPGDENLVTNVIDGKPGTRWHAWVGNSSYPHFFVVDMGVQHMITSFTLYRKTDDDRACDTFQLLTSIDNISWTDAGVFNFNRTINDGQSYDIPAHPKARYFKFIGLTGPQSYIVLGDISAYGF